MNLVDELVGTSFFDERDALTEQWSPDQIVSRDDELEQLIKKLKPIVEGATPRDIMVYGANGSGKTETVRYVLNEYQTAASVTVPLDTRLINCSGARTTNELSRRVLNAVRSPSDQIKYGTQNLSEDLADELDAAPIASESNDDGETPILLLGLDEIGRTGDADEFIYKMSRLNDDLENVRVRMIGVSVDGSVFDDTSSDSESSFSPFKVHFESYNAGQLQNILKQRAAVAFRETTVTESRDRNGTLAYDLESEVLADAVIPLIAGRSTSDGAGDARRALDLLWVAGDLALDDPETDKITEKHVDLAEDELDRESVIALLSAMDNTGREVAYALASLVGGGEEQPRTQRVYERYVRLANHGGKDAKSKRMVRNHLHRLSSLGLVASEETNAHGNPLAHSLDGYSVEQVMDGLQQEIAFFGVHEQLADLDAATAEVGQ